MLKSRRRHGSQWILLGLLIFASDQSLAAEGTRVGHHSQGQHLPPNRPDAEKGNPASRAALGVQLAENPFKPVTENPFRPKSESPIREKTSSPFTPVPSEKSSTETEDADAAASRPSRPPKRFRHGKYLPVAPPDDGWRYEPHGLTKLGFEPQRVPMTGIDFHEQIKQFNIDRSGTRGTLTARRQGESTQIKVLDFETGKIAASIASPDELLVLAVDNGGQRLAVVSDKFGFGEKRIIGTFLVDDSVLVEESLFVPFPDLRVPDLDVVSADFVGDHHLLAMSQSGRVSLWNLETLREECCFDLKTNAQIVCGADANVIAFADDEKYGLFDVSQERFLGVAPLPDGMKSPKLAISPAGERFVLAAREKAVVIDAANGHVDAEIPLSGGFVQRVEFATDDFLLVSSQDLYSISDRMLLWSYTGAENSVSIGGTTFFMTGGLSGKGSVIPAMLPDAQARAALETVHTQPDLFVVRPGDSVRLDVSKVPPPYRQTVQEALTRQIQERELTVAENSDVVIAASISGPEQKVVEYGRSALGRDGNGFIISEFSSTLEVLWKGKVAWSRKRTNAPGSVTAKNGQSIQDALREKTSQPNLRMFEQADFPRYIRKPDGKSVGSSSALGRSAIDEIRP